MLFYIKNYKIIYTNKKYNIESILLTLKISDVVSRVWVFLNDEVRMYCIELKDVDIDSVFSDSEYLTASENEYFSADESNPIYSIDSSSRFSMNSGSRYSSTANATTRRKKSHKMSNTDVKIKWTFDESEPRCKYRSKKHIAVDATGMRNYYMWRRTILSGHHPKDAACIIGSKFCFKQVKQKKNIQLFSIRLNSEHRVYFIIQEKEFIVKILNIGGHSFS